MSKEQTLEKINADILAGDFGKARDRLLGLIATYPDDLSLRRNLGDIYGELRYPAMAGRYWYLEANRTPEMQRACEAFERACGQDPLQILLALKFRGDLQSVQDSYARTTLLALRERVKQKHGYEIDLRKRGLAKYRLSAFNQAQSGRRGKILLGGCVILALGGIFLMVAGIISILHQLIR